MSTDIARCSTKAKKYGKRAANLEPILLDAAGERVYTTSRHDFRTLLAAPETCRESWAGTGGVQDSSVDMLQALANPA